MFSAVGRSAGTGVLVDALLRPRGVVVADVLLDDAVEVPDVEHENVVVARYLLRSASRQRRWRLASSTSRPRSWT
jgi:hypothetical protein